ncbi:MAG: DNA-packaging protein [Lentisphaeria bacterium]|nr:DNA-packaging protein [Lentisphaeria bacterium]
MTSFAYTAAQTEALKLLASPARHIMLFGGSRSGKTFVLCGALAARALRSPGSRHAVIRRYCRSCRNSIGCDTMPKLLRRRFGDKLQWHFNRTENVFTFPNGAEIWLIGLDDAERADKILGKEFATIYFNECSELDYAGVQTALTRLAQNSPPLVNKAFYDCNPPGRRHWTYRVFMEKLDPLDRTPLLKPDDFVSMLINPAANRSNLPPDYIENTLAALPRRQRARFLEGLWLDENENALWQPDMIARSRVNVCPELLRVVIGVDPAVTSHGTSDLTGIVAAGLGVDRQYYVLADRSMRGTPEQWVRCVNELYTELAADRVIGEVNNGGELISALLTGLNSALPFKAVRASRGKIIRAEPVAALYERNLVHHAGYFPELEEEMCSFSPANSTKSPDRMDALVWALTELSVHENCAARFLLA